MQSRWGSSGFADEIWQVGDSISEADAIEQIMPEGDALFFAGLFQTGEGITTTAAFIRAGAAADLSFNDVLTDIPFA